MADLKNIRKSISQIAKLLYDKDLTDSCGGNISVRDGDKIYITPRRSGESHQWVVEEDAIIVTDLCKVPLIGDIADIYSGLIRQIEYASNAEVVYTLAGEKAIAGGFPGYIRLVTKEPDDGFDQEIFIEAIDNQFSVYMDRRKKFAFIRTGFPRKEFEEMYPDAEAISFDYSSQGEHYALWWEHDVVFIAEYFYFEKYTRTLVEALSIATGEKHIIELTDKVTEESLLRVGMQKRKN